MSATLARSSRTPEPVYGRLFREGHADVLERIGREFPRSSPADRDDAVSTALLEMVRARRLSRWESGAIGTWADLARRRMVDELRRAKRREQRARLEPLTDEIPATRSVTPHEEVEAALSDWRVVELMAQMPPRAAAYVRLRVLEGGTRADVMAATGWSAKQYEKAQSAAKRALRAALGDLDSPRRCERYRHLIDGRALDAEASERELAGLHAHLEACGSCGAYSSEARRLMHGVAPLAGLLPASAVGGGALVGTGSLGLSLPVGTMAKSSAILCIGALCVGGAYLALHDGEARARRETHAGAPLQTSPSSTSTARRGAVTSRPARPRIAERRRERREPLELDSRVPQGTRQPTFDLSSAPGSLAVGDAESAFGLGASTQGAPAPNVSCTPGELGC